MEAGWLLHALLCHGYLVIIYPVVHVFKDQILATNTVDFGWSFYCALYLNITQELLHDNCAANRLLALAPSQSKVSCNPNKRRAMMVHTEETPHTVVCREIRVGYP